MKIIPILQKAIVFHILTFRCIFSEAQNPIDLSLDRYTPMSPEAAAVIKYVNYPVNHYTGLPNIEIPLFEVKSGDIILPITLSYHASGLKVKEESGQVGLGWTLNAEPSISRTINGLPDDQQGTNRIGYWHNWEINPLYPNSTYNYLKALLDGYYDEEPDDFYYKLIGKGGRFRFCRPYGPMNDYIYTLTYDPIYIDFTGAAFELIDNNGFEYIFGPLGNFRETNTFRSAFPGTTVRWLASKVKSTKTGASVEFTYHSHNKWIGTWDNRDQIIVEDKCGSSIHVTEIKGSTKTTYDMDANMNRYNEDAMVYAPAQGSNIDAKILQSITFINGRVTFETKNDNYTLQKMKVFNDDNVLVREIDFVITGYNNIAEGRTKLDSVKIKDAAGKVIEWYAFSYNRPQHVPPLTSNAYDHWGYYNGSQTNDLKDSRGVPRVLGVPNDINFLVEMLSSNGGYKSYTYRVTNGSDRESSPEHMKFGILEKIEHSLGTETVFHYSGNKYYGENSQGEYHAYVGGLHVSRIEVKDTKNASIERKMFVYGEYYQYSPMRNDCGILKQKVSQDYYMYTQDKEVRSYIEPNGRISRVRTLLSRSIPDLSFSHGAPMVFDRVNEWIYSPDRTEKLKTIYHYKTRYSADWMLFLPDPITYRAPFDTDNPDDWRYGHLIGEEKLKYIGEQAECMDYWASEDCDAFKEYNNYRTIYRKEIELTEDKIFGGYHARKVFPNKILVGDEYFNQYERQNILEVYWCALRSGSVRPAKETITEYLDSGEQLTSTKEFTYGMHMYPKKVTSLTSNGDLKEEHFTYSDNIPYIQLLEYNEKYRGKDEKTKIEYIRFGIPSVISTNTGPNNTMESRIRYHNYDSKGNPACISYEGGPVIVYIWGYKGQYPVAKIESISKMNSFYTTVVNAIGSVNMAILAGTPTDTQVKNIFTALRANSSLAGSLIISYTYKPLVGMTSETDPSGRTIFYEYDDFNRLKRMKDEEGKILKEYDYHYAQ